MTYTINTQTLENYGAHCESGKFADGKNYWKFKGGMQYVVSGLDRMQDAVAFIAAIVTTNNIYHKEFVSSFEEGRNIDGCGHVEIDVPEYMSADKKSRNNILRNIIWPKD